MLNFPKNALDDFTGSCFFRALGIKFLGSGEVIMLKLTQRVNFAKANLHSRFC